MKAPDRDHQHQNVDNHRQRNEAAAQLAPIGEEQAARGEQPINPECPRHRLERRSGRECLGRDRVDHREEHDRGNLGPADNDLARFLLPFDIATDAFGKRGLCRSPENGCDSDGQGSFQQARAGLGDKSRLLGSPEQHRDLHCLERN
jgi:hypothetical protein